MAVLSSSFRLLCFLGFCAWVSLPSASSPSIGATNSQQANAKPIAHFADVAQKAGLAAPVIFGGENTKKYIIETTGTGVAIFDYDNDGWPDIFVVYGSTARVFSTSNDTATHPELTNHPGTSTN